MPAGSPISGSSGTIHSIATGGVPAEIFQIIKWSLTQSVAVTKKATNSTSGWKGATPGTKDWSVTVDIDLDDANAKAFAIGSKYDIELHIDGTDTNYYSGTVVAANDGTECDIDEGSNIMYSLTLEGDGALTANGTI